MPYLAITESRYTFSRVTDLVDDIEVSATFRFETMDKTFIGQTVTIRNKTADVESLFKSWGYPVEASETITLLWQLAKQINEILMIKADSAFLFSSFTLEPHGNINIHSTDIIKLESGVSRISIKSRVKIYRKNVELKINKDEICSADNDSLPLAQSYDYAYTAQDDNKCFLFDGSGALLLSKEQSVLLTPNSVVKCYNSSYVKEFIHPKQKIELPSELLLSDLLAHYKRMESFSSENFDLLKLSNVASRYVAQCRDGLGTSNKLLPHPFGKTWIEGK